ncbi:14-3-3 domain-containing protein [Pseudomassariella vexata]|uniref:14-3-3 domain-containing protein n=1 Tax=Pseudomassariella vexata TaxID=1141098 RepID=A0A1Y2EJY0_9PEZI|nr:14-3-3 domain-containing protein [Pseudomassariella vexata]ORY71848.1 14-3-3 domain-containing protein [Pseudomassariella vexata]
MASSEVDQKFLGKLAKDVEPNNALLSSILFKILGLSINLAQHLVKARKQRRLDTTRMTNSLELYFHIIWLSREGLVMLEQYVLPMVGDHDVLKVLAYKLRASFYHIFALFHNNPPVSTMGLGATEAIMAAATTGSAQSRLDKGKGIARDDGMPATAHSSLQSTHPLEGGPVGAPPGFEPQNPEAAAAFLLPSVDFLPRAHQYFKEAVSLADSLLWGSHSLRLSVRTEYVAFLYECVHDTEGSRKLAKDTINEVYNATEGMDDDMFNDACELVTVLGKMTRRGLGASGSNPSRSRGASPVTLAISQGDTSNLSVATAIPPTGMENPI